MVYTGKSSDEKTIPCVICSAEITEDEDPKGTGNWPVRCTVAIKQSGVRNEDGTETDADSPRSDTQVNSAEILAVLMVDDLAEQITAAGADLTVFPGSIQFGSAESGRDDTGLWIDSLSFSCYACGSTLS
jgi:hypothetical protein